MMTIAIDWRFFNANLLGESKCNFGASRGSQFGITFLNRLLTITNCRDSDTFFSGDVLTGDNRKSDGFVFAYLDGFGVGNFYRGTDRGENRGIVLGCLRNISAVLTITTITPMTLYFGVHFDSGGNGVISLFSIFVSADFVGNDFGGFSTDSAGDDVALLFVDDNFGIQFNIGTSGFEGRDAYFSIFRNFSN